MYVLDTNVISELRHGKPNQSPEVRAWAADKRVGHRLMPDLKSDRDAMIAATALEHGMTVGIRNIADFAGTGVKLVDPFQP